MHVCILDKNHRPNNFLLKPSENYLVVTLSESDPGKRNPVDPHCGDSRHFVAISRADQISRNWIFDLEHIKLTKLFGLIISHSNLMLVWTFTLCRQKILSMSPYRQIVQARELVLCQLINDTQDQQSVQYSRYTITHHGSVSQTSFIVFCAPQARQNFDNFDPLLMQFPLEIAFLRFKNIHFSRSPSAVEFTLLTSQADATRRFLKFSSH